MPKADLLQCEFLRELILVAQHILQNVMPVTKREWHNAFKASNAEVEKEKKRLPENLREAFDYIVQRELTLTLEVILAKVKEILPQENSEKGFISRFKPGPALRRQLRQDASGVSRGKMPDVTLGGRLPR